MVPYIGMEKSFAPTESTTPTKGGSKPAEYDQQVATAKQAFIASALSMSWQLAAVVLIPVIGGAKLDEHFKTTPLITIVGFIVASIGLVLVLWRQLHVLSPIPTKEAKK